MLWPLYIHLRGSPGSTFGAAAAATVAPATRRIAAVWAEGAGSPDTTNAAKAAKPVESSKSQQPDSQSVRKTGRNSQIAAKYGESERTTHILARQSSPAAGPAFSPQTLCSSLTKSMPSFAMPCSITRPRCTAPQHAGLPQHRLAQQRQGPPGQP